MSCFPPKIICGLTAYHPKTAIPLIAHPRTSRKNGSVYSAVAMPAIIHVRSTVSKPRRYVLSLVANILYALFIFHYRNVY